jgi:hypothetical protein
MGSNKRDLKAYVRYDGTGRVVPGSLILNRFKPKVGNWKEVDAYQCCNQPAVFGCKNFWINQTSNPDNPDGVRAVGGGVDSKCNSFMFMADYWTSPNNPNQDAQQNFLLQKFNDAGDLLWNKVFTFSEDGTVYSGMDPQTMMIDNDDNVLCFIITYSEGGDRSGIIKFDNDGNQLWSIVLDDDDSSDYNEIAAVVFDSSSNIYLMTDSLNEGFYVKKISSSGVILKNKFLSTSFQSGNRGWGFAVNSNMEVYISRTYQFPDPVGSNLHQIVKLDSNFDEVWNKSFSIDLDPSGWNTYVWGFVLDKDENIVFNFSNSIKSYTNPLCGAYVKLSPNGDVIWTSRQSNTIDPTVSLGTFQLNSDSDGNIYATSVFPVTIPGYSGNVNNTIVIAKLSTDGSFNWAYAIEAPHPIYNFYYWPAVSGNIKNNSLVSAFYDDGNDPFNAQLFKLPLTALTDGVYGDYTITDITNLWTTSSPSFTLNDDTLTYTEGITILDTLSYLTFEQTYITTNTPL